MSELNIEDLKELPEYTRVREEFEIATKLRAAFHVGSAMLNVDELLREARRAPVSTPQQSAQRASVDTPEFRKLLIAMGAAVGIPYTYDALIAHINAWGSAGSGAIPEGHFLIGPGTVQVNGGFEKFTKKQVSAAQRVGSLLYFAAAPSPAPQGEQA